MYLEADKFWLEFMRRPGAWLSSSTFENITSGTHGGAERLVASLQQLASEEKAEFAGTVALYSPDVHPQSLLAATAAGVENMLPIAYRPKDPTSLYSRLVTSPAGPRLAVGLDLTGVCNGSISGSVKLDCYTWAADRWLASPPNASASHAILPMSESVPHGQAGHPESKWKSKAVPGPVVAGTPVADGLVHGYFIDYYWTTVAHTQPPGPNSDDIKSTVTNHDFVISRGGFFWDLSPWDDETPVDDPDQPLGSDVKALRMILDASNRQAAVKRDRAVAEAAVILDIASKSESESESSAQSLSTPDAFIHISGFTPWYMKYVAPNGKHQGVATEWQTMLIGTSYNAFVDADACCIGDMANAALFQHYPGPTPSRRFPPPAPPTPDSLVARGLLRSTPGNSVRSNQGKSQGTRQ